MKSKSLKGKSAKEIQDAVKQSLSDGFKPTLALVFSSVSQNLEAITKSLDEQNITVFGITTNGEFIDEETEKGSVAILLLDINKDYFQIYLEEYPEKNYEEVAKKIAQKAKEKFKKPAFLMGTSNSETDGEEILRGFEKIIGNNVTAFGASAGDDYRFAETFVFSNGKVSKNGLLCLAIDEEKIAIKGIATCGWNAAGTEKTVTKSKGNHVYTIDHIPALDITVKYGGLQNITPENKDVLMELAANFPLQLQRENGDPVMRPALVVDWTDNSFYTSGTVPQGSKVRFSLPPDWDVMDKVIKGVEKLKAEEMPEADALIVFSCAGRILSFGPMMTDEIEGIKNVWNVPMIGMFSNAELARATGGNLEMHNLTTCCVAIKER
ncbi:FIST signal transduction protein [Winogradskyella schleiferi]|uniref:FIST signal transduction protein n=1 Tax=Winogradskyella schleiferi TaxID=2686078 RepID=UPI0015C04132|nr:FIST N-terminal domain-containing protein [Winogradskyella schleiferi]